MTADSIFSGITTFAKLPWVQCLGKERDTTFDIAFIGAPFVRYCVSIHSQGLIDYIHRIREHPTDLVLDSGLLASVLDPAG